MAVDSAHGFLEEASETMKARAQLRDAQGGERSMAKTVAIFNAWTGNNLSEDDGWRFMISLKQAREVQGKYNRDDYVDLAAYCGLLGEFESGSRPHPLKLSTSLPEIDPSLLKEPGRGPGVNSLPNAFGRLTSKDLGRCSPDHGNPAYKIGQGPYYATLSNASTAVDSYALRASATSQIHNYSPDEPVGVPYGAVSLGPALNEE